MRTSPTQFMMMVDFMERNGDLAKPTGGPRGRQWATTKWRELTAKLNSDGTGESRSEEKWRKVWTDFKNNTKRKAAKLNRSMTGTGGGPALKLTLTDLELRVLAIMGEQAATGMSAISEVGFDRVEQEVELESQEVASNQVVENVEFGEEPSSQLDIGDEDWNFPSTSQDQILPTPAPTPAPTQTPNPTPNPTPTAAPTRKWAPLPKKNTNLGNEFLKAERDRDKMYYELEKERLRQRDFELDLQAKWLAFMNEALSVLRKFMEGKLRDE